MPPVVDRARSPTVSSQVNDSPPPAPVSATIHSAISQPTMANAPIPAPKT